jgi:hypothetical protein
MTARWAVLGRKAIVFAVGGIITLLGAHALALEIYQAPLLATVAVLAGTGKVGREGLLSAILGYVVAIVVGVGFAQAGLSANYAVGLAATVAFLLGAGLNRPHPPAVAALVVVLHRGLGWDEAALLMSLLLAVVVTCALASVPRLTVSTDLKRLGPSVGGARRADANRS